MNMHIADIMMKPAAAGRSKATGHSSPDNSFLSLLGKARSAGIEKMKFNQPRNSQAQGNETSADFQACLSALRSGLLAKGKPMSQVRVGRSDVPLLNNFLGHCGYSREEGSQLIDDLLASSPEGEIVMSRFLAKVRAAGAPQKKAADDIILDVSTVPYMESLLKAFGCSGDEVDSVLNTGRMDNGGLELKKLIRRLKSIGQKALQDSRGVANLNTSPQTAETLQSLGINVSGEDSNGRITILDFVSSLKRIADTVQAVNPESGKQGPIHLNVDDLKNLHLGVVRHTEQKAVPGEALLHLGKQSEIPAEVNNAINRIIEKTTASNPADDDLTTIIKNSKIGFDDPASKKIGAENSIEDNTYSAAASKEKLAAVKGEGRFSAVQATEDIKSVAAHGSDANPENAVEPKTPFGKTMAGVPDMPLDGARAKVSTAAQGFERTPQPTESTLPNHVIDQLGRQISRSLVRGDGIVQLRLKPAELGTVRLEMQMVDNHMNVSVAAENGAVKELLLANVQELKEMLQAQGIRLEKLDVQVGDNFRQAYSDLSEGAAREHSSHQGDSGKRSYADDGKEQDTLFDSREPRRQDAIVDLVA